MHCQGANFEKESATYIAYANNHLLILHNWYFTFVLLSLLYPMRIEIDAVQLVHLG